MSSKKNDKQVNNSNASFDVLSNLQQVLGFGVYDPFTAGVRYGLQNNHRKLAGYADQELQASYGNYSQLSNKEKNEIIKKYTLDGENIDFERLEKNQRAHDMAFRDGLKNMINANIDMANKFQDTPAPDEILNTYGNNPLFNFGVWTANSLSPSEIGKYTLQRDRHINKPIDTSDPKKAQERVIDDYKISRNNGYGRPLMNLFFDMESFLHNQGDIDGTRRPVNIQSGDEVVTMPFGEFVKANPSADLTPLNNSTVQISSQPVPVSQKPVSQGPASLSSSMPDGYNAVSSDTSSPVNDLVQTASAIAAPAQNPATQKPIANNQFQNIPFQNHKLPSYKFPSYKFPSYTFPSVDFSEAVRTGKMPVMPRPQLIKPSTVTSTIDITPQAATANINQQPNEQDKNTETATQAWYSAIPAIMTAGQEREFTPEEIKEYIRDSAKKMGDGSRLFSYMFSENLRALREENSAGDITELDVLNGPIFTLDEFKNVKGSEDLIQSLSEKSINRRTEKENLPSPSENISAMAAGQNTKLNTEPVKNWAINKQGYLHDFATSSIREAMQQDSDSYHFRAATLYDVETDGDNSLIPLEEKAKFIRKYVPEFFRENETVDTDKIYDYYFNQDNPNASFANDLELPPYDPKAELERKYNQDPQKFNDAFLKALKMEMAQEMGNQIDLTYANKPMPRGDTWLDKTESWTRDKLQSRGHGFWHNFGVSTPLQMLGVAASAATASPIPYWTANAISSALGAEHEYGTEQGSALKEAYLKGMNLNDAYKASRDMKNKFVKYTLALDALGNAATWGAGTVFPLKGSNLGNTVKKLGGHFFDSLLEGGEEVVQGAAKNEAFGEKAWQPELLDEFSSAFWGNLILSPIIGAGRGIARSVGTGNFSATNIKNDAKNYIKGIKTELKELPASFGDYFNSKWNPYSKLKKKYGNDFVENEVKPLHKKIFTELDELRKSGGNFSNANDKDLHTITRGVVTKLANLSKRYGDTPSQAYNIQFNNNIVLNPDGHGNLIFGNTDFPYNLEDNGEINENTARIINGLVSFYAGHDVTTAFHEFLHVDVEYIIEKAKQGNELAKQDLQSMIDVYNENISAATGRGITMDELLDAHNYVVTQRKVKYNNSLKSELENNKITSDKYNQKLIKLTDDEKRMALDSGMSDKLKFVSGFHENFATLSENFLLNARAEDVQGNNFAGLIYRMRDAARDVLEVPLSDYKIGIKDEDNKNGMSELSKSQLDFFNKVLYGDSEDSNVTQNATNVMPTPTQPTHTRRGNFGTMSGGMRAVLNGIHNFWQNMAIQNARNTAVAQNTATAPDVTPNAAQPTVTKQPNSNVVTINQPQTNTQTNTQNNVLPITPNATQANATQAVPRANRKNVFGKKEQATGAKTENKTGQILIKQLDDNADKQNASGKSNPAVQKYERFMTRRGHEIKSTGKPVIRFSNQPEQLAVTLSDIGVYYNDTLAKEQLDNAERLGERLYDVYLKGMAFNPDGVLVGGTLGNEIQNLIKNVNQTIQDRTARPGQGVIDTSQTIETTSEKPAVKSETSPQKDGANAKKTETSSKIRPVRTAQDDTKSSETTNNTNEGKKEASRGADEPRAKNDTNQDAASTHADKDSSGTEKSTSSQEDTSNENTLKIIKRPTTRIEALETLDNILNKYSDILSSEEKSELEANVRSLIHSDKGNILSRNTKQFLYGYLNKLNKRLVERGAKEQISYTSDREYIMSGRAKVEFVDSLQGMPKEYYEITAGKVTRDMPRTEARKDVRSFLANNKDKMTVSQINQAYELIYDTLAAQGNANLTLRESEYNRLVEFWGDMNKAGLWESKVEAKPEAKPETKSKRARRVKKNTLEYIFGEQNQELIDKLRHAHSAVNLSMVDKGYGKYAAIMSEFASNSKSVDTMQLKIVPSLFGNVVASDPENHKKYSVINVWIGNEDSDASNATSILKTSVKSITDQITKNGDGNLMRVVENVVSDAMSPLRHNEKLYNLYLQNSSAIKNFVCDLYKKSIGFDILSKDQWVKLDTRPIVSTTTNTNNINTNIINTNNINANATIDANAIDAKAQARADRIAKSDARTMAKAEPGSLDSRPEYAHFRTYNPDTGRRYYNHENGARYTPLNRDVTERKETARDIAKSLLDAGVDPKKVAAITGWRQTKNGQMRYYSKINYTLNTDNAELMTKDALLSEYPEFAGVVMDDKAYRRTSYGTTEASIKYLPLKNAFQFHDIFSQCPEAQNILLKYVSSALGNEATLGTLSGNGQDNVILLEHGVYSSEQDWGSGTEYALTDEKFINTLHALVQQTLQDQEFEAIDNAASTPQDMKNALDKIVGSDNIDTLKFDNNASTNADASTSYNQSGSVMFYVTRSGEHIQQDDKNINKSIIKNALTSYSINPDARNKLGGDKFTPCLWDRLSREEDATSRAKNLIGFGVPSDVIRLVTSMNNNRGVWNYHSFYSHANLDYFAPLSNKASSDLNIDTRDNALYSTLGKLYPTSIANDFRQILPNFDDVYVLFTDLGSDIWGGLRSDRDNLIVLNKHIFVMQDMENGKYFLNPKSFVNLALDDLIHDLMYKKVMNDIRAGKSIAPLSVPRYSFSGQYEGLRLFAPARERNSMNVAYIMREGGMNNQQIMAATNWSFGDNGKITNQYHVGKTQTRSDVALTRGTEFMAKYPDLRNLFDERRTYFARLGKLWRNSAISDVFYDVDNFILAVTNQQGISEGGTFTNFDNLLVLDANECLETQGGEAYLNTRLANEKIYTLVQQLLQQRILRLNLRGIHLNQIEFGNYIQSRGEAKSQWKRQGFKSEEEYKRGLAWFEHDKYYYYQPARVYAQIQKAGKINQASRNPDGSSKVPFDLLDRYNGGTSYNQAVGFRAMRNLAKLDPNNELVVRFRTALKMYTQGKSAGEIWSAVQVEMGVDGQPRIEIGDGKLKENIVVPYSGIVKLGDILDNPEYFACYPDAKDIDILFVPFIPAYAQYDVNEDAILVNEKLYLVEKPNSESQNNDQKLDRSKYGRGTHFELDYGYNGDKISFFSVLSHELQHRTAAIENFEIAQQYNKTYNDYYEDLSVEIEAIRTQDRLGYDTDKRHRIPFSRSEKLIRGNQEFGVTRNHVAFISEKSMTAPVSDKERTLREQLDEISADPDLRNFATGFNRFFAKNGEVKGKINSGVTLMGNDYGMLFTYLDRILVNSDLYNAVPVLNIVQVRFVDNIYEDFLPEALYEANNWRAEASPPILRSWVSDMSESERQNLIREVHEQNPSVGVSQKNMITLDKNLFVMQDADGEYHVKNTRQFRNALSNAIFKQVQQQIGLADSDTDRRSVNMPREISDVVGTSYNQLVSMIGMANYKEKFGERFVKAYIMQLEGKSAQEIWDATHLEASIDGQFWGEIQDGTFIPEVAIREGENNDGIDFVYLSDFYDAPEFYKTHPEFKKLIVQFDKNFYEKYPMAGAVAINHDIPIIAFPYDRIVKEVNGVRVACFDDLDKENTLIHELQHAVQMIEYGSIIGTSGASKTEWSAASTENLAESASKRYLLKKRYNVDHSGVPFSYDEMYPRDLQTTAVDINATKDFKSYEITMPLIEWDFIANRLRQLGLPENYIGYATGWTLDENGEREQFDMTGEVNPNVELGHFENMFFTHLTDIYKDPELYRTHPFLKHATVSFVESINNNPNIFASVSKFRTVVLPNSFLTNKTGKLRKGHLQLLKTTLENAIHQLILQQNGLDAIADNFKARNPFGINISQNTAAQNTSMQDTASTGYNQIVGIEGARQFDRVYRDNLVGNLKLAIYREQEGLSPYLIWRETGWERGKDGQWRTEISDTLVDTNAVLKYVRRMNNDKRSQEYFATLGDIYPNEELYSAYPHLRNVIVRFVNLDSDSLGKAHVDKSNRTLIELNKDYFVRLIDGIPHLFDGRVDRINHQLTRTLIHEIQHLIQEYENHGVGASIGKHYGPLDVVSYYLNSGEVEARNAEKRAFMPQGERENESLRDTEDTWRIFQNVKYKNAKYKNANRAAHEAADMNFNADTDYDTDYNTDYSTSYNQLQSLVGIAQGQDETDLENYQNFFYELAQSIEADPQTLFKKYRLEQNAEGAVLSYFEDGEFRESIELEPKAGDLGTKYVTTLGKLYDAPELYKRYPNLIDVPVAFYEDDSEGLKGSFSSELVEGVVGDGYKVFSSESIVERDGRFYAELTPQAQSTLIHEIEHNIQQREGIEHGTSLEAAGNFEDYKRNAGEIGARISQWLYQNSDFIENILSLKGIEKYSLDEYLYQKRNNPYRDFERRHNTALYEWRAIATLLNRLGIDKKYIEYATGYNVKDNGELAAVKLGGKFNPDAYKMLTVYESERLAHLTLRDLYDNPELYEKYPFLRAVKVRFGDWISRNVSPNSHSYDISSGPEGIIFNSFDAYIAEKQDGTYQIGNLTRLQGVFENAIRHQILRHMGLNNLDMFAIQAANAYAKLHIGQDVTKDEVKSFTTLADRMAAESYLDFELDDKYLPYLTGYALDKKTGKLEQCSFADEITTDFKLTYPDVYKSTDIDTKCYYAIMGEFFMHPNPGQTPSVKFSKIIDLLPMLKNVRVYFYNDAAARRDTAASIGKNFIVINNEDYVKKGYHTINDSQEFRNTLENAIHKYLQHWTTHEDLGLDAQKVDAKLQEWLDELIAMGNEKYGDSGTSYNQARRRYQDTTLSFNFDDEPDTATQNTATQNISTQNTLTQDGTNSTGVQVPTEEQRTEAQMPAAQPETEQPAEAQSAVEQPTYTRTIAEVFKKAGKRRVKQLEEYRNKYNTKYWYNEYIDKAIQDHSKEITLVSKKDKRLAVKIYDHRGCLQELKLS